MASPDVARLVRRVAEQDATVRAVSDTLLDIKETVDEHTEALVRIHRTLDQHSEMLAHQGTVLDQHSEMLAEILRRLSSR